MESQVIKPSDRDPEVKYGLSVFLAGSIEMGRAENWQLKIEKILSRFPITIFNPRRDDWDSSWTQQQSNEQFNHQVNWELNRLDESTIVFMYFSPGTQSPISLLELGRYSGMKEMIVCCPKDFWRRGNVEILCTRNNTPMFEDLESAIGALITKINLHERN
jgi:hypothetical protein